MNRISGKESTCQAGDAQDVDSIDVWVRKSPWRRKWQLTPVLLPGIFHGQRSLLHYSPWECKELDKTEHTLYYKLIN